MRSILGLEERMLGLAFSSEAPGQSLAVHNLYRQH